MSASSSIASYSSSAQQQQQQQEPSHLTPEAVASLPPPGLSGPSQPIFAPDSSRYLAFISVQQQRSSSHHRTGSAARRPSPALYTPLTATAKSKTMTAAASDATTTTTSTKKQKPLFSSNGGNTERVLLCLDLEEARLPSGDPRCLPLLRWNTPNNKINNNSSSSSSKRRMEDADDTTPLSLEERLRRERQRLSTGGSSLTQFSWTWKNNHQQRRQVLRLLIPARGSLYIQDGIPLQPKHHTAARCLHDKTAGAAIDPQLSPDGQLVAWTTGGELYCKSADADSLAPATQLSFGDNDDHHNNDCIRHGVADFVAQEEMDRYRGFWWHPDSHAILFTRTDESNVPVYRIMHQDVDSSSSGSSSTSNKHNNNNKSTAYEDHRYPFAGKENPSVKLGLIQIDRDSILSLKTPDSRDDDHHNNNNDDDDDMLMTTTTAQEVALHHWHACQWIDPPREACEYLARIYWLPDGSVVAQWQNRTQNVSVWYRIEFFLSSTLELQQQQRPKGRTLVLERSDVWINLHHMFEVLPRAIHPAECSSVERDIPPMPFPLPVGSFSFLLASERSDFAHLYLYTYVPGINGEQAVLIKAVTAGEWVVEHIVGVDMDKDVVYCTGTYDSALERHLYAVPFLNNRLSDDDHSDTHHNVGDGDSNPNGVRRGLSKVMHALSGGKGKRNEKAAPRMVRPVRLTVEGGMHSIVMDECCRYFVDTSSDLERPTSVRIYELPREPPTFSTVPNNTNGANVTYPVRLLMTLYDAMRDDKGLTALLPDGASSRSERLSKVLPPPELLTLSTADGTESLHAALYRPDPLRHGPGPYPLVCAVYGGPHVQRVSRSWSQSADLRAQRLRSLGFCVVKCDNRGSSRRGIAFERAIAGRLGRVEVLDQVAVVRQLVVRGIADGSRVGVYGWSYGGYLSAMCLCRAPDVFHVAVAGAPVTSWDGYDTHYTERYMGLPSHNPSGYREAAVFDHVPNMQGKLMIVHGLIDENVHFRHTARLINKLIASGKEYDLLIFPEERHSPRRLRDRIYMEQRISDYFVRHLGASVPNQGPTALDLLSSLGPSGLRGMAGHL